MFDRRARKRTAWLAVLAVLLNTFTPLVSRAFASSRPDSWLEVCGGDRAEDGTVTVGQVTGYGTLGTLGSAVHCPYCVPHGASFGLAPPSPLLVPFIAGPDAGAKSVVSSSLSRFLWNAKQARAPPSAH
jgi:hypothetical protein